MTDDPIHEEEAHRGRFLYENDQIKKGRHAAGDLGFITKQNAYMLDELYKLRQLYQLDDISKEQRKLYEEVHGLRVAAGFIEVLLFVIMLTLTFPYWRHFFE